MPQLKTQIEVYKDGHREVYHSYLEPARDGWAWTHPDTQGERDDCSACTSGTLTSVRENSRREKNDAANH